MLQEIATRRHVWLRVVREDGTVLADVDRDVQREPLEDLERFFLGGPSPPPLRDVDAERGPLRERGWFPSRETVVDCNFDHAILFCEARKHVDPDAYVLATESSARGVIEVYGLRHRLLRLALLTSPLAIFVAWLTARRARVLDDLLAELERRKIEHERFVADLVHELKSPVAAVRAAAEALGSPDERTGRLTRAIEASGRRLESVVARFLDLSRAEAGFPDEERIEIDVEALVIACLDEDPRAVTRAIAPGLVVRGIEPRLSAMIRELLDNALSFADHVTIRAAREGAEIVVRVEDDGPGIAAADLERIFDRYFTTRGDARGTGLGLPFVRAVAEAHGGRAWATSGPDGATVGVRLPAFTRRSPAEDTLLTRA